MLGNPCTGDAPGEWISLLLYCVYCFFWMLDLGVCGSADADAQEKKEQ